MQIDHTNIYEKYLTDLKAKLIQKYNDLGLRASGKYEDDLETEVSKNKLIVTAPYHSWFMERGRKASDKFPPREVIEEWIEVKQGLPPVFKEKKEQFAYLIARKIAKEGIKVPNEYNKGKVISEIVNEFLGKTIYKMLNEIGEDYFVNIKSDILKTLKNVNTDYD